MEQSNIGRDAQEGLFEVSTTVPSPRRSTEFVERRAVRPVTNDMDLIEAVLVRAQHPGYVLLGRTEQVWRRITKECTEIERAATHEAIAVHQLLAQGLLELGPRQPVHAGRHHGFGYAVHVPDSTSSYARRWGSYQRPASWGERRHTEIIGSFRPDGRR